MDGLPVAGVDVGGPKKGFHAVLLREGAIASDGIRHSVSAKEIAAWCRDRRALVIGVDAPCRFRAAGGEARLAERELMRERMACFVTPTLEKARTQPSGFYDWMLNGAELYRELERSHALFAGGAWRAGRPICFETFPHAIACALAGRRLPASEKRVARRNLLNNAGIDVSKLPNLDYLDAALCAFAASYLAIGSFKLYGDLEGGLIVVPKLR